MDLVDKEVADRLELVRKEFGYSYSKLAELIGYKLKGDTLRKSIDRGRVQKIYVMSAIHKLNINSDWMFKGIGEMKIDPTSIYPNIYLEKNDVKISIREITKFLDDHEQILMDNDEDYKVWWDDKVNNRMFKVFRDNNIEFKVVVNNPSGKQ